VPQLEVDDLPVGVDDLLNKHTPAAVRSLRERDDVHDVFCRLAIKSDWNQ
jgi:hypothetical protein